jgi:hypothetical protein
MQRLLGTFPNRSAGLALLILRLAVATTLISSARLCPGTETDVLFSSLADFVELGCRCG